MASSAMNIRMNSEDKIAFEALCKAAGYDVSSVMDTFVRKALSASALPFSREEIRETEAALAPQMPVEMSEYTKSLIGEAQEAPEYSYCDELLGMYKNTHLNDPAVRAAYAERITETGRHSEYLKGLVGTEQEAPEYSYTNELLGMFAR